MRHIKNIKEVLVGQRMIQQGIIKYSFDIVILNQMRLWADMIGLKVSNVGNQCGMFRQEPNKLCKASTMIPLWNLLAILETRVQHKNGVTPKVCTLKLLMIRLGLGENFEWSQTCDPIWNVIEQPH